MRQRSLLFKRRRRGGILLELVLTIPFSLALIFIVIDVGRLVLASAALHDSVSVAARAGARTGEIGDTRQASGSGLCPDTVRDSTVYEAFCNAGSIPGAEVTGFRVITPAGNICRVGDIYVTVTAAADFEFLTDVVARGGNKVVGIGVPGLGSLFRSTKDGLTGSIHATGTARCEVAR
jgi:Flp pilus assembly protein TadG